MWLRKWKFEIFTICGTISVYFLISSILLNTFHSFDHSSSISEYTTNGIFGVNIYGWMKGDFGGGTTARCLVQSLMANNLPISAITINGADLHSHTNSMIQKLKAIATTPQNYLFDLLAINAANTLPILQDSSNQISSHRYRIGLWHWETSYLPDEQGILGGYYDEIWAPSEYVANAIISTPSFPSSVRVSIIPYGYESLSEFVTPQLRLVARSQLLSCIPSLKASQTSKSHQWPCPRCSKYTVPNMIQWSQSVPSSTSSTWRSSTSTTPAPVTPEAPYVTLFLVIFDFNSDFQRKNVLGIISAFRIAFPHSGDAQNTGLILKSSNGQHQPDDYRTLLSALDDYDEISRRIVFMDGVLSTTALKTLKRAVDCYISLHRSEGWGLNILESVLMGVPVIHTAFGGSEQFMKPLYEHSLPELRIPATMINITRPFGPYSTSMKWANPSQGAAVYAMTQVHKALPYYHSMAEKIRTQAISLLSPAATGKGMADRLRKISFCLCHLGEHLPSSTSFFSSTSCHETSQQQSKLVEKQILIEIEASTLQQRQEEVTTSTGDLSLFEPPQEEETKILRHCQRYILGKRIFKEKLKRLK